MLEDRQEYIALLQDGLAEQQQRQPFETLVIVNPRLSALTNQGARFFEGCLSVPGYQVGPCQVEQVESASRATQCANTLPLAVVHPRQAPDWLSGTACRPSSNATRQSR